MRPKGEISLNKVYRCKLCGAEFTSIPVYWNPFGEEYVISGKTLLKHHLITRHGKRSLKKKYFEKVKLD